MPGDRLPDTGPHDDLLADADRYVAISANPRGRYALVRDLAAALRAKIAETKSESRHCDRAETAFTNVEADLAKVRGELADALDRLDANEGTIAALRQQLADAREHDDRCESWFQNPPGANTPCACAHRLAEARAAAPHDRQSVRDAIESALTVTTGVEKLDLADSVRLIIEEEGADALIDTVIAALLRGEGS